MSFGFSIGDFITVLQLADSVRQKWLDAPQEYAAIFNDTRNLSNILRDITDFGDRVELTQQQATDLSDCTSSCTHVLKSLEEIVDKNTIIKEETRGSRQRLKRVWKRFRLDVDEIRQIRAQLTSTLSALSSTYGSIVSNWTQNVREDVEYLKQSEHEQGKLQIADWFADAQYTNHQNSYYSQRHPTSCVWFLENQTFLQWQHTQNATLLCPGIPGSGKTTLMATVVNFLQESYQTEDRNVVIYHYYNFKRPDEQKLRYILSSFIRQLFLALSQAPESVEACFRKHKKQGTRPTLDEMMSLLNDLTLSFDRVSIIVDALDESEASLAGQDGLVTRISLLQSRNSKNVQLLASTRQRDDILKLFPDCLRVVIRAQPDDLNSYLEGRMTELVAGVQRNKTLQDDIRDTIMSLSDGMFLLAKLHFDSLRGQITPRAVKRTLQNLPHGSDALFTAYQGARERIDHQLPGLRDLAKQVLMWITYGLREFTIRQLQHAIAIETGMKEIDEELDLVSEEDILSVCAGLIVFDADSQVIRLVHYTTQECLELVREEWFSGAQETIVIKCVAFLSLDEFSNLDQDLSMLRDKSFHNYQFVEYAAHCWGFHAGRSGNLQLVENLSFHLYEKPANFRTFGLLIFSEREHRLRKSQKFRTNLELLHVAAFFGFKELAKKLISTGANINVRDSSQWTPLLYAIHWGNAETAEVFLSAPDIELRSDFYLTSKQPLIHAAWHGNLKLTNLLLTCPEIDPNAHDSNGSTALSVSIRNQHLEVVNEILSHPEINPNLKPQEGSKIRSTNLTLAAAVGDLSILESLLKHPNIYVNDRDIGRASALFVAATFEKLSAVKMLLTHQRIDVNAVDENAFTPLLAASFHGNLELTQILCNAADIDLNLRNLDGRTVLAIAAQYNRISVAKFLLSRPGIDVNLSDLSGNTPIGIAAGLAHVEIVQLLLATQGVNLHFKTLHGHSPLSTAIEFRKFSINADFEGVRNGEISELSQGERMPELLALLSHETSIKVREYHNALFEFQTSMRNEEREKETKPSNKGDYLKKKEKKLVNYDNKFSRWVDFFYEDMPPRPSIRDPSIRFFQRMYAATAKIGGPPETVHVLVDGSDRYVDFTFWPTRWIKTDSFSVRVVDDPAQGSCLDYDPLEEAAKEEYKSDEIIQMLRTAMIKPQ